MPGLGAFALAGAAGGLGKSIIEQAEKAREERLMALKRGWEVEDREANQAFDREMQEQRQGHDRSMAGLERGWSLEDRAHEEGREDDRINRTATVYESLFGTESGGDFDAANDEGYVGRSQFGQDRLDDWSRANGTPRVTIDQFRKDENLQKAVEEWHFRDINERIDADGLVDKYEGKVINGVRMTRSGIIAMAHLGGYGGAKKHLESNGEYNPADSNGTSLSKYAKTHGGLSTDMSQVWRTLADPNVDESVKDDIRERVGRGLDPSSRKNEKLTGMDWRTNGDGTETAYGQKSDGTWAPHRLEDGSPYSREEEAPDAPRVSNETLTDLEREFRDDIDGTDWNMVRTVEAEIERLMAEENMAEPEAKRAALGAMRWKERKEGTSGFLGIGAREPSEEINADRRGEFFDFVYDDAPSDDEDAATETAPPPQRTPQRDPQIPPDPGAPNAGSVAPDRAKSGRSNLPAPKTKAEMDKLPKGTRFVDPTGTVRIKS